MNPISIDVLSRATEQTVKAPLFEEKIVWWLQGGHATERWFQFEWAFQLHQVLEKKFTVLCEQNRIDVVCIRPSFKPEEKAAGIEVKLYGNWWIKKRLLSKAKADIEKANKYPFPAVALIFLLVVTSSTSSRLPSWVNDQIERGDGVHTGKEFIELFTQTQGVKAPDESVCIPFSSSAGLSTGCLYAFAYYNSEGLTLASS